MSNFAVSDQAQGMTNLPRQLRWWLAVLFGVVIGVPVGCLLSYAAALPFFIGAFFFALLGLLIGAFVYRIAARGGPYSRGAVLGGTILIVLVTWAASLAIEARDFPTDMARTAMQRTRDLQGKSASQYQADFADDVRSFLRDRYPPGGAFGYVRWVIAGGELQPGDVRLMERPVKVPHAGIIWIIQSALSLVALTFGIGSQTFALRQAPLPPWEREG